MHTRTCVHSHRQENGAVTCDNSADNAPMRIFSVAGDVLSEIPLIPPRKQQSDS